MHSVVLVSEAIISSLLNASKYSLLPLLSQGDWSEEDVHSDKDSDSIHIYSRICKWDKAEIINFYVHIDCLKLTQHKDVEPSDIPIILDAINKRLAPAQLTIEDFRVNRIDYCKNFVLTNPLMRKCLFDTLQKERSRINYLQQTGTYKTGLLWYNRSREMVIYSKNDERKARGEKIAPYEQDVIRAEIQLKSDSLKYLRYKMKASLRMPDHNYWINTTTEKKYIDKTLRYFIAAGDFWSLPKAIELVQHSAYSGTRKKNLIAFLRSVAADGLDALKCSANTRKRNSELLSQLNVNPLTIPANYSNMDHIENIFFATSPKPVQYTPATPSKKIGGSSQTTHHQSNPVHGAPLPQFPTNVSRNASAPDLPAGTPAT
ncbi:MAG: phage/plasmid replication protein [Anaerovoracaceae bacterium]